MLKLWKSNECDKEKLSSDNFSRVKKCSASQQQLQIQTISRISDQKRIKTRRKPHSARILCIWSSFSATTAAQDLIGRTHWPGTNQAKFTMHSVFLNKFPLENFTRTKTDCKIRWKCAISAVIFPTGNRMRSSLVHRSRPNVNGKWVLGRGTTLPRHWVIVRILIESHTGVVFCLGFLIKKSPRNKTRSRIFVHFSSTHRTQFYFMKRNSINISSLEFLLNFFRININDDKKFTRYRVHSIVLAIVNLWQLAIHSAIFLSFCN